MGLAQLKEQEPCEICAKTARKEAVNDMKKNLIMDAAQRIIARDGYLNARLENIAEEAGFSKASIYHYFADKEALIAHMAIRELREDYHKCKNAAKNNLPFMEFVRVYVMTFFDNGILESSNLAVFDMASAVMIASKHEDLMADVIKYKMGAYEILRGEVERAMANGEIDETVDKGALAAMIVSFTNSTVMMRGIVDRVNSLPKDVETENDVILRITPYSLPSFEWIYGSLQTFLSPWMKNKT